MASPLLRLQDAASGRFDLLPQALAANFTCAVRSSTAAALTKLLADKFTRQAIS